MSEERTGRESINCADTPTIIFQNVKFQYSKERELLKNISFQMSPGRKNWNYRQKMEVANPQSSNCYSDSMNLMTGPFYAMIKTFMI